MYGLAKSSESEVSSLFFLSSRGYLSFTGHLLLGPYKDSPNHQCREREAEIEPRLSLHRILFIRFR